MNTRRNFFKVLGLAGGVAATGVAGAAALVATSGKSEAIKKIETSNNSKLSLCSEYGELEPPGRNTFSIAPNFVPGTYKRTKASMTVGPDGEMYLNINGKWRKILTE